MFLEVELTAGTMFKDAYIQAYNLGRKLECHIKFRFNGVDVRVYTNRPMNVENAEEIYDDVVKTRDKNIYV